MATPSCSGLSACPPVRASTPSQVPHLDHGQRVLAIDGKGRTHLVSPPSSLEDPSEFPNTSVKQSSVRTSHSTTDTAHLLPDEQFEALRDCRNPEDYDRVYRHALALASLRQRERAEYLEQLEQAKLKIAKLESELATLPALCTPTSHFDLARLQSENEQLTSQSIALARKLRIAAASGRADGPQRGTGGQDALYEKENRKLKADVLHLERRLAASEIDSARLTTELRRLRPFYLQGAPLVAYEAKVVLPPEKAAKPGARAVLLGDAEAELLLQAGKTHSHVRRIQRISLDTAIQEQAEEIVQATIPAPAVTTHGDWSSGGARPLLPSLPLPQRSLDAPEPPPNFQLPLPPSLRAHIPDPTQAANNAVASDSIRREGEPVQGPVPVHGEGEFRSRIESPPVSVSAPASTSSTLTFHRSNEDVHASVTTLPRTGEETTPGADPSLPHRPMDHEHHSRAPIPALVSLPTIGRPLEATSPSPAPTRPSTASAPEAPPPASTSSVLDSGRFDGFNSDITRGGVDVSGTKFIGRTPSALDLLSEAAGAMRSGSDAEPYNPRSRKPRLDANGEKKARSPYIKWNVREDEQLLKAVIECGCAWDSVAKLCPTRAYHQVRQRFLRGLRSGETLPPELMYLQAAVRKSVADYESRKKKKRPGRQLSVDSHDYHDPRESRSAASPDGPDQGASENGDADAMQED